MDGVLREVATEVVRVALMALVSLAVPLTVQILRRVNVQLSVEEQARVNALAMVVAAEVEEWAATRIKANLTVDSAEKLQRATERLVQTIPGMTPERAERAVTAALPQLGLGAAAALKEIGRGRPADAGSTPGPR